MAAGVEPIYSPARQAMVRLPDARAARRATPSMPWATPDTMVCPRSTNPRAPKFGQAICTAFADREPVRGPNRSYFALVQLGRRYAQCFDKLGCVIVGNSIGVHCLEGRG